MTQQELYAGLQALNIPVAYSHFSKAQTPPYITFYRTSYEKSYADDKPIVKLDNYAIELYVKTINRTLENQIESFLESNEIPYEASETWIDSEKLFEIAYEITI